MPDPFANFLGGSDDNVEMRRIQLPLPRIFRVRVSEIPNGHMLRPGHAVNLNLSGTVKMIDDEGDVMINVTRVDGKIQGQDPTIIVKPEIEPAAS